MTYFAKFSTSLGELYGASDGESLLGLWFEGQKYFAASLEKAERAKLNQDAIQGGLQACSPNCFRKNSQTCGDEQVCLQIRKDDCEGFGGEPELLLPVFQDTRKWLELYERGCDPGFFPKLAPQGSDFRKEVWDILLSIPFGQTMSYGQIAKLLEERHGKRMSAQAVGGAVGHNPISIIIPCHRVLGADGSLTGYAGGLHIKKMLLDLEGVGYKED